MRTRPTQGTRSWLGSLLIYVNWPALILYRNLAWLCIMADMNTGILWKILKPTAAFWEPGLFFDTNLEKHLV